MGRRVLDIAGKKYNKLTVLYRAENANNGQTRWVCECECDSGKLVTVQKDNLISGNVKSCGCLQRDAMRENNYNATHGLTKSKIYGIYKSMKYRCLSVSNEYYSYYGGRGISVCDEWTDKENGFVNFYNWAMSNGYTEGLTIDRKDVNGNYEPVNCRWATMKEQGNNRRSNVFVEIEGVSKTASEWADEFNINRITVYQRIQRGITGRELIQAPKRNQTRKK